MSEVTKVALHNAEGQMIVVDVMHKDQLLASGNWFENPNDIKRGNNDEKQNGTKRRNGNGKSQKKSSGT